MSWDTWLTVYPKNDKWRNMEDKRDLKDFLLNATSFKPNKRRSTSWCRIWVSFRRAGITRELHYLVVHPT